MDTGSSAHSQGGGPTQNRKIILILNQWSGKYQAKGIVSWAKGGQVGAELVSLAHRTGKGATSPTLTPAKSAIFGRRMLRNDSTS